MKTLVTLVFLVLTLFAIPVQGDQYLSEAQKELLLENSRALGQTSKREQAQNASKQGEQTNMVKQQSRPVKSHRTNSRYLGVISSHPTSQTSTVANHSGTTNQSFQSAFKNADWGTPSYSGRPIRQSQQARYLSAALPSNSSLYAFQRMILTNNLLQNQLRNTMVSLPTIQTSNISNGLLSNGLTNYRPPNLYQAPVPAQVSIPSNLQSVSMPRSSGSSASFNSYNFLGSYKNSSLAPASSRSYDIQSGNSYSTTRMGGQTTLYGNNIRTGSTWNTTYGSDGSSSGTDAKGNNWQYNATTGSYSNPGTGKVCTGFGVNRICR